MKIKENQKLTIVAGRKGKFKAVAHADFDTETDDFASVAVDQEKPVRGMTTDWQHGDHIPVRCSDATFTLRK